MALIKVATLNLHGRQHRWLERRHLIVAAFLDNAPDLISLQEIHRPSGQGSWLQHQLNHRLTGRARRPYRLIQKRKHHLVKGYFEGVAILSKLPILAHDWLALGYGGRVALRANVELPSRETLDFVAVHLHHLAADHEARQEQVMALTGWLNDHNPAPMQVIAGDFNEVPGGLAIQHLRQAYRSAMAEARGSELLATYPTLLAHRGDGWAGCLDYVFISKAMPGAVRGEVICNRPAAEDDTLYPSDHVGLLATLAVGGPV